MKEDERMNRINLICIGVHDMKESLAFYKAIGFQTSESEAEPAIVFFDTKGTKLELYPIDGLARDINEEDPPKIAKGFSGITLAINMKSETEVDEMIKRAEAAGGKIVKPPQRVFWGGYSGYFVDPSGVYWEVAYGANWEFDENDMLKV